MVDSEGGSDPDESSEGDDSVRTSSTTRAYWAALRARHPPEAISDSESSDEVSSYDRDNPECEPTTRPGTRAGLPATRSFKGAYKGKAKDPGRGKGKEGPGAPVREAPATTHEHTPSATRGGMVAPAGAGGRGQGTWRPSLWRTPA